MSANRAKINFTGNLVRDPEIKQINESTTCSFTVAVRTDTKKPDGTYDSNYYDCSYWGEAGNRFAQLVERGTLVYVTGDFCQYEYESRENPGTKRYRLRVRVTDAYPVARLKARTEAQPVRPVQQAQQQNAQFIQPQTPTEFDVF